MALRSEISDIITTMLIVVGCAFVLVIGIAVVFCSQIMKGLILAGQKKTLGTRSICIIPRAQSVNLTRLVEWIVECS